MKPSTVERGKGPAGRCASIELRHLRYFLAAVDQGSFRAAAFQLGVRQSAVSRRIRDLERLLGARLFARHPGGVLVTAAGRRFCPLVRALMEQVVDAAEVVAGSPGERTRHQSGRTCAGSAALSIASNACATCAVFGGSIPLPA